MSKCIPAGVAFRRLIQLSSTLLQRGCAAPEGALPRPGSCRQTFGGMGFVPAGSSIFPGRVIGQDNSGLIGRGGGLCSGWVTPLSESGRVRERQVGCRQPVGGMGFDPAGRGTFCLDSEGGYKVDLVPAGEEPPDGPQFSCTRVKRRVTQLPNRPQTKTGNNQSLDQRVGCNRWLGGPVPASRSMNAQDLTAKRAFPVNRCRQRNPCTECRLQYT